MAVLATPADEERGESVCCPLSWQAFSHLRLREIWLGGLMLSQEKI
jgi:hypothetical protein